MARSDSEIHVKITSDSSQAQSNIEQTAKTTESFGSRFKSTFTGVLAAGVVQNLASKVFDFGKQSVEAYESAEATTLKFKDALSRIPGASDAVTASLAAYAKQLSAVTVFSAGQSKAALATLASYGLTGDQLKTLLPLVQDYATKTGKDLPTAAGDIGKAMLGQGRALKGVGLDFKDTKTLAGNYQEVVAGLTDKVGGLSTEMGQTSAGKMQIYQNQIKALKVQVGSGLVPAIEAVMPVLQPLMAFFASNAKVLVPIAIGVIAIAAGFLFLNFAVGLFMANPPVLLLLGIAAAIVGIVVVIIILAKYWDTIWHGILVAVHWVWDFIVAYWPLLLPILFGPIGIAAALIIMFFGQIKAFIGSAVGFIAAVWGAVYGFIVGPVANAASWVWGKIQAIGGWFAGVASAIAGALSGVFGAIIGPFESAWNWIRNNVIGPIKGAWNAVAGAINSVNISVHIPSNPVTDFLHIAGKGFDWSPPHVPTLAQGGLMTASGLVFAHAGEVISPAPASVTNRTGPAVVITHAHFSERVDVTTFGRRLAWTLQTQGV
jgi:hypothetical protein